MMEGPGAESEEKREPASDIETAAVDSLKCLTQIGRLEKRTSTASSPADPNTSVVTTALQRAARLAPKIATTNNTAAKGLQ
jgi:hypothetical protein